MCAFYFLCNEQSEKQNINEEAKNENRQMKLMPLCAARQFYVLGLFTSLYIDFIRFFLCFFSFAALLCLHIPPRGLQGMRMCT